MKIRISLLACLSVAPVLIAGCVLYKNPSACEQQMRSMASEKFPDGKLSISHAGVAIKGSRVVVEGTIESTPAAASAALAVSAPDEAAAEASAAVASASSAASTAGAASAAAPASATAAASAAVASAKPKKVKTPTAAECLFKGEELASFTWLAPSAWVTPADSDSQ
ncbi:hypothetical protein FAZ95_12840 [Trinickia violacea]|uniref:Lipoprotein n=1 Tax=Trinickia violacea TaxID=2571746 RepID=A0A4V1EHE5_9BURK|nr:hypothetical protein [Trinickia violacea]QCP49990.1 hypothetical protein FAZ95_12840 [Trinickia violacea]